MGNSQTPLGLMLQGKAKICTLHYWARQSQALNIKTYFSVSYPPQCQSHTVACVRAPRMFPQSGHFLVMNDMILHEFIRVFHHALGCSAN